MNWLERIIGITVMIAVIIAWLIMADAIETLREDVNQMQRDSIGRPLFVQEDTRSEGVKHMEYLNSACVDAAEKLGHASSSRLFVYEACLKDLTRP